MYNHEFTPELQEFDFLNQQQKEKRAEYREIIHSLASDNEGFSFVNDWAAKLERKYPEQVRTTLLYHDLIGSSAVDIPITSFDLPNHEIENFITKDLAHFVDQHANAA